MNVKRYKKDFIFIITIILFGIILFTTYNLSTTNGNTVIVSINGEFYEQYFLDNSGNYVINSPTGTNTLVIEDNHAFLKDASCPDKLCVHMGKISHSGQSIICLPNKVVITIKGEPNVYDSISE